MDLEHEYVLDLSSACMDCEQPEDSCRSLFTPSLDLLALDGDLESKLRGGEGEEEGVDLLDLGVDEVAGESDVEDVPAGSPECSRGIQGPWEEGEAAELQGLGDAETGLGQSSSSSSSEQLESQAPDSCAEWDGPGTKAGLEEPIMEYSSNDDLDSSSGAASLILGNDPELEWTDSPLSQGGCPSGQVKDLQSSGHGGGDTSGNSGCLGEDRDSESVPEVASCDGNLEMSQAGDSPDAEPEQHLQGLLDGQRSLNQGNELNKECLSEEDGEEHHCPEEIPGETEPLCPPTERPLGEAGETIEPEPREGATDTAEDPETQRTTGPADVLETASSAGPAGTAETAEPMGAEGSLGVPEGSDTRGETELPEGLTVEQTQSSVGEHRNGSSSPDSEGEGGGPVALFDPTGCPGSTGSEPLEAEETPGSLSCEEEQQDTLGSETQAPSAEGETTDLGAPQVNGSTVNREEARRLAEQLYRLDGVRRTDVVKQLDKDNAFCSAVGEEYLKFFDFSEQTLDEALRSFLKVVVLIGETQERERVLEHFAQRYHHCNPSTFSSTGAVLTLTCAIMLLNTDLHGQNIGKVMSINSFVSNLEKMNEGQNFPKDLLKGLYNSIKNEPLEWAVDEEELKSSLLLPADSGEDAPLRSKSNPFQDVPHDKKATVFKQGFLTRKAHADIDGKRTPWGKRSWKTFYAVLKGMVLYLQKNEYHMDWQSSEEVVSVHHALAEKASEYTKRPHVFRLQTADWRVFLFQASTAEQMSSWICRINLVSALYSSPPFPAAVGSQKKFSRPILPATKSRHSLLSQLDSHTKMLESFSRDLADHQQNAPEGRKSRTRDLEEHRQREEYLQHEKSRYEVYLQLLRAWQAQGTDDLERFDGEVCEAVETDGEELKKSHSSPSLNLETPAPVVKVKRNISERRTYRKIIIPRRNKEL
nr:PREDICTED: PH and SEC7 domain-containing protein 1-like [Lepisosteus oculatus]XP_015196018.1 PREDICTED: PH and SEC7 domain-containing protein 1-like [Lepisosteus oculatus]XP_015196022.1 PREDICTED: PH and SEC7 domain-containing protein 1-like [Lepisosteus oculatus]XP_015196032.1 PREDICTED: PH and SEC7 domain-containing protein 1-like [Lepisosteus oculatus]XP_015196040.1 PREDICTED: PH and SEC7 domain-containing protein 1-like [Lepisosteus oculatus]